MRYPYPEKWFTFRGVRIAYLDQGEGHPVIFLHGQASDLLNYEPVYPLFRTSYHTIALDYPGFGKSDKPDIPWQEHDLVELLDTLFSTAGIETATLIGHSYGGYVAMVYGADRPERVESMVLVSPAGIQQYTPEFRDLLRKSFTVETIMATTVEKAMANYRKGSVNWTEQMEQYATRRSGLLKTGGENYRSYARAMVHAMELMLQTTIRDRIGSLSIPTLIIWGRQDALIPYQIASETLKYIPRAQLVTLDNCGHFPMLEYPERFFTIIDNFLKGTL